MQYTTRPGSAGDQTLYSGRSGEICPESKNLTNAWAMNTFGFVHADVDEKRLKLDYVDLQGKVVYTAENGPRKGKKPKY